MDSLLNSKKYSAVPFFNKDGPLMIAVDVTNKCNFNCLHCFNNSGKGLEEELSDDEVLNLVDEIADIRPVVMCFCGGEPLLRFSLILKCLKKLNNNLSACNMVSNGYLMTQDKAYQLKEEGLSAIQYSLDGLTEMQHDTFRGVRGAYEHVLHAIKYAKNADLRVDISFVPNKLNHKDISNFIDFCYNLGVSEVRSMPFIPMGRGSKANHLILSNDEYITYQQSILCKQEQYKFDNFRIEWGDPVDHLYRMPNNFKLGIPTYSIEILANGDISASSYFPIIFGNIRKHSLREYWEAGLDNIWGNKKYMQYVGKIESVSNIGDFSDKYGKGIINLELIN